MHEELVILPPPLPLPPPPPPLPTPFLSKWYCSFKPLCSVCSFVHVCDCLHFEQIKRCPAKTWVSLICSCIWTHERLPSHSSKRPTGLLLQTVANHSSSYLQLKNNNNNSKMIIISQWLILVFYSAISTLMLVVIFTLIMMQCIWENPCTIPSHYEFRETKGGNIRGSDITSLCLSKLVMTGRAFFV